MTMQKLQDQINALSQKSRYRKWEVKVSPEGHASTVQSLMKCKYTPELRRHHLVYGFLRGRSYAEMEPEAKSAPNWSKVVDLVDEYGICEDAEQQELFHNWMAEGKFHFEMNLIKENTNEE